MQRGKRGKDIDYGEMMKELIELHPPNAFKEMQRILKLKLKGNTRCEAWDDNPVNTRWHGGKGLLELAVDNNREDLFNLILSYIYIYPFTILQYTAATKNAKYLELLLANKDKKYLIPGRGQQPGPKIDVNFFYDPNTYNYNSYDFCRITALCCAAKTDDSTCLQLLLKEPNIDLNLANGSNTPLYAAMRYGREENVNILINDDRLYKQTPLSRNRTSLLVAAQVKFIPEDPHLPGYIVCQKIISRLLYNSKHTKAQLALNIIDMDGNSILSGACNISDLKLFKYFLYANGWGTKIDDTHPEKLDTELDSEFSPNNAENWTESSELFRNFLNMNDALRSSIVASELLFESRPRDKSQFAVGIIPHSNIKLIVDTINAFYVRDTDRTKFINILASTKITQFVKSGGKDNIQKCMVELLVKIREDYGIIIIE